MRPDNGLFDRLCSQVRVTADRRGEAWADCPFCGKGERHFSFSPRGYHCFACGQSGGLYRLADHLGLDGVTAPPPKVAPPPPKPKPPPLWLDHAAEIVAQACAHPDRTARWAAYKPLGVETLDRWQFGFGRLPAQAYADNLWLIVPLIKSGRVVGLRGRNLPGQPGPKWTSAAGTRYVLWGVESIRPGGLTWIVENYTDAAWLMERCPDFDAVAIGGAANWRDEWTAQLVARRPALVVVALDNDLAGQAQGETYEMLRRAWLQDHADRPALKPPTPNGPRIANLLMDAGLRARLWRWPDNAPPKADMGWLIGEGYVE